MLSSNPVYPLDESERIEMETRPLPVTIFRLFLVSYFLILLTFIASMINLGWFSQFVIPITGFLTSIYHITLVVLSKLKVGSPPPTRATLPSSVNQQGASVYPPPSPTGAHSESNGLPTLQERHGNPDDTVYPSYVIHVATCISTFVLALLWAAGSWPPICIGWVNSNESNPRRRVLPYLEGIFGCFECTLLFCLFGLFVHHRRKQLRAREFIRMDS
ncbi:hypothetical protein CPB86DRAFT_110698 [Serendipita vermifera]|nr:hypothetical protein CPB86DRAFT_110698 [Serendipita vermifera]